MPSQNLSAAFTPLTALKVAPGGWLKERVDAIRQHILPGVADAAFSADLATRQGFRALMLALGAFSPLAAIGRGGDLTQKAQALLELMLASSRDDGSFGPAPDDIGYCIGALDPLMQFFSVKRDKRILEFLTRFMAYVAKCASRRPLTGLAQVYAMEIARTALWLTSFTGAQFLPKLCRMMCQQSVNWTGNYLSFPFTRDLKRVTRAENLTFEHKMLSDGLANARALKYGVIANLIEGGNRHADAHCAAWEKLMRWHGLPIGMFSCDSHLSGLSPSQGADTRAVTEALVSMAELTAITGDAAYAQRMETLAIGALDAALSPDGKQCQAMQQPNQICCDDSHHGFYDSPGALTRFNCDLSACCAVARGFGRYMASLWARSERSLTALSLSPCTVRLKWHGTPVRIEVAGQYPYGETIRVRVFAQSPVSFKLNLRIPDWAEDARAEISGGEALSPTPGAFLSVEREWSEDEIRLSLPMIPRITRHHHESAAVRAGALLFALPLEGKLLGCDYVPSQPFGRALCPEREMTLLIDEHAPPRERVAVRVCLVPVKWNRYDGSASAPPVLPGATGSAQQSTLLPYATTPLRICAFPVTGAGQPQTIL